MTTMVVEGIELIVTKRDGITDSEGRELVGIPGNGDAGFTGYADTKYITTYTTTGRPREWKYADDLDLLLRAAAAIVRFRATYTPRERGEHYPALNAEIAALGLVPAR